MFSFDDLIQAIQWYEGLSHGWQIVIAVGALIVTPWAVCWWLFRRHYFRRYANLLESKDRRIESHELKIGLKDTIIAQKDATIEQLGVRLAASESSVRASIEKPDNTPQVLGALQRLLAQTEAPLLEFQPSILAINPLSKDIVRVRVFLTMEVRNLGAPTALHGWQIQVKLPKRSAYLTEHNISHSPKPMTGTFENLVNLVANTQTIVKGGKVAGFVEFEINAIEGEQFPLNVRQVVVSVSDYTGKRYEVPVPSFEMPFQIGAATKSESKDVS